MEDKVFVNRILNMRKIKYIGLDMDHTLIRYNTELFESKVYELMIKYLIKEKQYPSRIQSLVFSFELSIRGLVIDKKNGNILKLSRYGGIRESHHGTKRIDHSDQKRFYRSTYIDLGDSQYTSVDTAFSMAVCGLYQQLVDLKDEFTSEFGSYEEIARDVLVAVDQVHSIGELKKYVSEHLDKFIIKDDTLVAGLKRYLKHGKKIFIITNSDFEYTNLLLTHAINGYLDEGQTWSDLFEYVITLADKPRFFYDKLRFLSIDPQSGKMSNVNGKLQPGIYQGGCATKFTNDLQLNGDQILYIGDHIYGDVLRLKKDCNWRTALVVEELGLEISGQQKAKPYHDKINQLIDDKRLLESRYTDFSSKQIEENTTQYKEEIETILKQVVAIDKEIKLALDKMRVCFNPHWERVFRAGAEESYFAHQVNRFACIYMEKISDLFNCSPRTYFRAKQRKLSHELNDFASLD